MKRFNYLIIGFLTVICIVVVGTLYAQDKSAYEVAVIIEADKFIPADLYVPSDRPVKLWVANSQKKSGTLVINFEKQEKTEMKSNRLQMIDITAKDSGSYELAFISGKNKETVKAGLVVGNTKPAQSNHMVILSAFKKIKPNITNITANIPTTISLYSTVSVPHGNIGLFGTAISFPLKSKKVETVTIEEGLKPGTYLISRPGYPKQNHKIRSKVVVR